MSELSRNSPVVVNAIKERVEEAQKMRFTKALLEQAAPVIQANLRSATNLPTRDGLKQFYDTESAGARRSLQSKRQKVRKSLVMKPQEPHLLDLWEVGYRTGRGGHGSIVVSNPKVVTSKNGAYPLFKLLWEGTSRYVVPMPLSPQERSTLIAIGGKKLHGQYLTRMREQQSKLYSEWARLKYQPVGAPSKKTPEQIRTERLIISQAGWIGKMKKGASGEFYRGKNIAPAGTTTYVGQHKIGVHIPPDFKEFAVENAPKKMSFYNRFKGKFYYNVFQRRGIEGDVVMDFHEYVSMCILNGLSFAVGEQQDERALEAIGQERYV
jgi:hypothetical protein